MPSLASHGAAAFEMAAARWPLLPLPFRRAGRAAGRKQIKALVCRL